MIKKIKKESAYFLKQQLSDRFFLLLWKASLIILSNLLTWAPIIICGFLAVVKKSFLTPTTYNWIFVTILPINSFLNIFIHSKFNTKTTALKKKLRMFSILFFFFFFFRFLF